MKGPDPPEKSSPSLPGKKPGLRQQLDVERRHAKVVAAFFADAAKAASDDRSVFQLLAERAMTAVGDSAVVTLVSDDGEWLDAVGVAHPDPDQATRILAAVARRPLGGSIYGDVIAKGAIVFIPKFKRDDPGDSAAQMSEEQRQILARSQVHSVIALPLLLNGRVAGVLAASRIATRESYTKADVEVLQALAGRASIALDNARVHRVLRATTNRLETIISESPIATVVLDADGRIEMWNRASEALFGWAASDVVGTLLPSTLGVSTHDPVLHGVIADSAVVRGHDMAVTAKDSRSIPVSLYAAPLLEGSTLTGSVLRWVDLSEQRALQSQLLQAQRLESVGRLAGGIAHDFNNILTAILGFARLVDEDTPASDPRSPHIKAIEDAGERAAALVRQLLAFGRQQVLDPEVLNLADAVRSIAPMLSRVIGEDVSISLPASSDTWPIEADRSQLEQVIVNLAVNARDAMPRGGRLTIETENIVLDEHYVESHPEVTPGPHVMLAVSDTGTGIAPELQGRIFEPFFTTKEAGRGTGLGLATVYGIVRQSGGHIWVYSEADRGTTFRLYFPRTTTVGPSEPTPLVEPNHVAGTATILVAEDEPVLRDLIEVILGRLGYVVLMAGDADEAISLARNHSVDLLLSDVVMPGRSGFDLASAIRAHNPDVRVLLMSGYTTAALEPHGLAEGDVLLQKPFTRDSLARAVRDALTRVPS